MKLIQEEQTLATAAAKAGMDEKTARKYRDLEELPSQTKGQRTWRTRKDAFEEVWPEILLWLQQDPDSTAKSLMARLQRDYPGRFPDGQLRTLQRRIREWRHVMARALVHPGLTGEGAGEVPIVVGAQGKS